MTEDKRIVWTNIDLDPEDWYDDLRELFPNLDENALYEKMWSLNNEYESHIDYAEFKGGVYPKMGFPTSDATVYRYDNGNCTMTRPTVTVLRGDGFGLTLRYTAIFPIRWNGKTYQSLKVPITVSSYYKFK